MKRSVILIILDGWGLGPANEANPIHVADPPLFKKLAAEYPVTSLQASGISVGLPWGEVGNSEVGHLTLGAGKVIYQFYPRITMAIQDGSFFSNPAIREAFAHAKANGSSVNLVGLLTKAHTHAAREHLDALIQWAAREQVAVNLHLFADGLDSSPRTVSGLLESLPADRLATLTGRYYAMDRNENWALVQKTFECLTGKGGAPSKNLADTLEAFYKKNSSEEFLPPIQLDTEKRIKDNDAIIFFNFREDGVREIARAFTDPSFHAFPSERPKNLKVVTLTRYDEKMPAAVAFPADNLERTLGKVLADAGKTQLRLAETYKYAHVTYFFNGHAETPFPNEYRALVPSLNIPHPDERPELVASAITDRLIESLRGQAFDFILVNYANPDTMGHTGNYDACLKAVAAMDKELTRVVEAAAGTPAVLLITSDHGNIEEVINPTTGAVQTSHDANPVPFYIVADEFKGRKFSNWANLRNETVGILADVAPTILELLEVPRPEEMTGESLLKSLQ